MADDGSDTTRSAPGTWSTAPVSCWANERAASNVPAGQVVLAPLEPGVRHPLVDEDDDRRVGSEERAEGVGAGRDAGPVGLGDGRERGRAPEPPGELAPQRADLASRRRSAG